MNEQNSGADVPVPEGMRLVVKEQYEVGDTVLLRNGEIADIGAFAQGDLIGSIDGTGIRHSWHENGRWMVDRKTMLDIIGALVPIEEPAASIPQPATGTLSDYQFAALRAIEEARTAEMIRIASEGLEIQKAAVFSFREQAALAALNGLVARGSYSDIGGIDLVVQISVKYADALIAELGKERT